ncbi:hypothetical protein NE236_37075 [Actinoallomurus purpureus]|uniref:hypothetical protein n=1 Tax=Actinoallomurus purpureus TaxID=478114 RepID=UPI0020923700|nr:hypothetical protein [Actinoallomurus purpureus]MCO6010585.1 hypothetical protein [Actinoallomurus purpureus]
MRRLTAALGTTMFLGLLTVSAQASTVTASPDLRAITSASITTPEAYKAQLGPSGIAYLPVGLNLQPTPSGTWANSSLQVTLPTAGIYSLDLDVRGRLSGNPPVNAYIVARLLNVTSNAVLPNSERLITQIIDGNGGTAPYGVNTTAPISERIRVGGPTTIRLQATRINAVGSTFAADILSDPAGRTSFRFERTFP